MNCYDKDNPETIRDLFNSIAKNYDRTNGILSLQMHKCWNRALIHGVLTHSKPKVFLDLCCGTGIIAFGYLKHATYPVTAYMLDFSNEMLAHAKLEAEKLQPHNHNIIYLQADARNIPLPEKSVNCATIAYGIRNIKNPRECIQDIYRVLEPGGTFGMLELTKPKNPILKIGHKIYMSLIVPSVGKFLTSNKSAYCYLKDSIHTFISPEELKGLMHSQGFVNIRQRSLFGGVATILTGKRPA